MLAELKKLIASGIRGNCSILPLVGLKSENLCRKLEDIAPIALMTSRNLNPTANVVIKFKPCFAFLPV